ncbi:DUF5995 family protein [Pelagicoccus sp. SDUM812003]|uniref:DUF5995 family protein n=1 Tax=Pelagicoccus sp. SDUM812003 TaxID=3041267 RepID=UPI00280F9499|nr:DUF5995 family protein [Pelagicoccus sp. SDUM812003]MDQ8204483.1 DUF5995 family protein [Pelagicoccus sp. SDUM812003]
MADTIDEVISELAAIVQLEERRYSAAGFFPALYRRVTIEVKKAIQASAFQDNQRMERLDVVFANRYIDAYNRFQNNEQPTQSWKFAFEQTANSKLTTLQHLLLGMNAHISLDLGIAAAAVCDAENPLSLKEDFYTINHILGSLINDTQRRLTRIFGPLGVIDHLLGPIDESISLFSIGYARDKAWAQTLELLLGGQVSYDEQIMTRDRSVAGFGKALAEPTKRCIRILLLLVRVLERGNVSDRIRILNEMSR